MTTAKKALELLREGNQRFVAGMPQNTLQIDHKRRNALVAGQNPMAMVLACSDSRVPVEIIFDQGLGDLFVIRVAGNIAAPSQIGSIEFAAEHFGTALVVVLGHSRCGAVAATLEALQHPKKGGSKNLRSIVERIQPALQTLLESELPPSNLLEQAVRANVGASALLLRQESPIIEEFVQQGKLQIVGAEYSLESGVVDFFEEFSKTL